MKKLFCFLAVASTAAFTSCSSDDDSVTNPPVDQVTGITLTSNTATGLVGDAFTFTVKNNLNEDVTSASTIFVNDVEIDGSTYTATAEGTYTVHATNGDFTSDDVTLTVTEEVIEITSLVVTYDTQIVNIGETITFTATANGDMDVTAGATFMVSGEEIEGNTFTPDAAGVYEITASYEGYVTEGEEEVAVVAVVGAAVTFTETDVNNSALMYLGRVSLQAGGFADYWSIISYEGTASLENLETTDNYLDIEVLVPVAETDEMTLPSVDNASFYSIYQMIKDGQNYPVVSIESGTVTGVTEGITADTEPVAFNIVSAFNADFNASSISLNYNGAFDNIYDNSQQGRGTVITIETARAAKAQFTAKFKK